MCGSTARGHFYSLRGCDSLKLGYNVTRLRFTRHESPLYEQFLVVFINSSSSGSVIAIVLEVLAKLVVYVLLYIILQHAQGLYHVTIAYQALVEKLYVSANSFIV